MGLQIGYDLVVFLSRGHMMVPAGLVLHHGRSLALGGIGHDQGGLALHGFCAIKCRVHGVDVVAVDADDIPSEGRKARLHGILVHDLLGGAGDLQAVAVHHGAQVVQLVLGGAHGALPDGALGQLAVAHHHIGAGGPLVHLLGQRHADRHRQPVAQGTGIHLDAGQLVVRMADEFAAKLAVLFDDLFDREEALLGQHRVEGLHAVALGHYKHVFAVPTTAGTGSEATLAAVLVDGESKRKFTINAFPLIPHYAVLDPRNTVSLPPFFTATTGMDALTHAVEAYIGQSTTRQTRAWSVEAVKLVHRCPKRAYDNGSDLEARQAMLRASYVAGMSFTRSYVGYCHAVAHSLGGRYDTPHGLANSVLLPYVLRAYGKSVYRRLKELAIVIGLADERTPEAFASESFIRWIEAMNENMGIPRYLSNIRPEDIESLSRFADHEGNPLYPVPRLLDRRDLQRFYAVVSENSSVNG